MAFTSAAFLFGLAALAVPPVVHLLNRRRYQVVDWAATMFLPASAAADPRFKFDHLPLMLVRMGLLAALVAAFAGPQLPGCHGRTSTAPADVVIVIDGSASMGRGAAGNTPLDRAKEYARNYLAGAGGRAAILVARRHPVAVLDTLTADATMAKNCLELVPPPAGVADWPAALQQAAGMLASAGPRRAIIAITDDRRFGWADGETLPKWSLLGANADRSTIHVVNIGDFTGTLPPNAGLEPIRADRAVAVAGREIEFRSAVRFGNGAGATTVRVLVDGTPVNTLNAAPVSGGVPAPVAFAHKFPAGPHLVTFELPPDGFAEDDRQDFALEVLPAIPVLLIDGGPRRGSSFLRDALAPAKDDAPAFLVKTMPVADWQPGLLTQNVAGPNTPPRAVALLNLDKPTADQCRQLERYLRDGGGLLVALGDRTDFAAWNRAAFRGGDGFLPAHVGELLSDPPTQPLVASFTAPALEIFKTPLPGGLATATFPKRFVLDPIGPKGPVGSVTAAFTTREPWLIERNFGAGRVTLSAVPFDDSAGTNLHRLPDFVRLAHELFYALAGTHAAPRNLQPGQPLVVSPGGNEPPGELSVRWPDGRTRAVPAAAWPAVVEGVGDPGPYLVTTPGGRQAWYAVGRDPREADATPNSQADRDRVADLAAPLRYLGPNESITFEAEARPEPWPLWGLLLALVALLLLGEIALTRRLVKSGDHLLPGEG